MKKKLLIVTYEERETGRKLSDKSIFLMKTYQPNSFKQTIKLFYSSLDSNWSSSVSGTMAAKLEDDGDGVTVTFDSGPIRLDYSELQYLRFLLEENEKNEWTKETVKETKLKAKKKMNKPVLTVRPNESIKSIIKRARSRLMDSSKEDLERLDYRLQLADDTLSKLSSIELFFELRDKNEL